MPLLNLEEVVALSAKPMADAYGDRLLTQNDLDATYSKIQELFIQFKAEIIVEQRRISAESKVVEPKPKRISAENFDPRRISRGSTRIRPLNGISYEVLPAELPKARQGQREDFKPVARSLGSNTSSSQEVFSQDGTASASGNLLNSNSMELLKASKLDAVRENTTDVKPDVKPSIPSNANANSDALPRASRPSRFSMLFSSGANGTARASEKGFVAAKTKFSRKEIEATTLVQGRHSDQKSTDSDCISSRNSEVEEEKEAGPVVCIGRRWAQLLAKSAMFDVACGVVICGNAALLCIETEFLAQTRSVPKSIDWIQFSMNIWYTLELILRVVADGCLFFVGKDRLSNIGDTLLVITAALDFFLTSINARGLGAIRILRVLRFFRILRTLRIIRQMKYIREFRKMVCSLTASLPTLFWSLLMVFGVMYSFALWFTQSAAYFHMDGENDESLIKRIDKFYSSYSRTVYTLFAAISGGYSWHEVLDPWIESQSYLTVICFLMYISVSVFGLMNIVTSVFVESAMHATRTFQDLLLDEKKKEQELYTIHMQRIFHHIDQDGGGTISFKEMRSFIDDEESQLAQYLEALGISSSDVFVLFRLLDTDGSGQIDIDEFCEGCMRLRGAARSFDINCMMYENRAMLRRQAEFMEFVESRFDTVDRVLYELLPKIEKRMTQYARISPRMKTPQDFVIETPVPRPASPLPFSPPASDRQGQHHNVMTLRHVGVSRVRNALHLPRTPAVQMAVQPRQHSRHSLPPEPEPFMDLGIDEPMREQTLE